MQKLFHGSTISHFTRSLTFSFKLSIGWDNETSNIKMHIPAVALFLWLDGKNIASNIGDNVINMFSKVELIILKSNIAHLYVPFLPKISLANAIIKIFLPGLEDPFLACWPHFPSHTRVLVEWTQ